MIRSYIHDYIGEAIFRAGPAPNDPYRSAVKSWLQDLDKSIMESKAFHVDAAATEAIEGMASTATLKHICSGMYPPFTECWIEFDTSITSDGEYDTIAVLCSHDQDGTHRDFEMSVFAGRNGEVALPMYSVSGSGVSGSHKFSEIGEIVAFVMDTQQSALDDDVQVFDDQDHICKLGLRLMAGLCWSLSKAKPHNLIDRETVAKRYSSPDGKPEEFSVVNLSLSAEGVAKFPGQYPSYDIPLGEQKRAKHWVRAHPAVSCLGKHFWKKSHVRGNGESIKQEWCISDKQ